MPKRNPWGIWLVYGILIMVLEILRGHFLTPGSALTERAQVNRVKGSYSTSMLCWPHLLLWPVLSPFSWAMKIATTKAN